MAESMAIFEPVVETKTMKDAFNEMVFYRLEYRGREHVTGEYKEVLDRNSEIFKELLGLLPEDKRNLLFEFDEGANLLASLDEERLYKLGLSDGKELVNLF